MLQGWMDTWVSEGKQAESQETYRGALDGGPSGCRGHKCGREPHFMPGIGHCTEYEHDRMKSKMPGPNTSPRRHFRGRTPSLDQMRAKRPPDYRTPWS